MKRNILLTILLLVLSLCLCIGCEEAEELEKDPPVNEDPVVTATKLELSGMKTEFEYGEAFSSEGLVVTIVYSDGTSKVAESGEYKVSSTLYDAKTSGTYSIVVTCSSLNLKATYKVTVARRTLGGKDWKEDGILKILMIGNSYSDDSIEYVYQIGNALGVEVRLGNLFVGNCSVAQHISYLSENQHVYEYRTCNRETDGKWVTKAGSSGVDAITSENWDFISLQENSTYSGQPQTYARVGELVDVVRQHNQDAALVWNMPWADSADSTQSVFTVYGRDQMRMYNAYVSMVNEFILTRDDFVGVLATGTAIQNARTFFGPNGNPLNRDGHHLSWGIGRFIASLNLFATLSGEDISALTYMPSGVSAEQLAVAIESVQNALETPFAVSPSKYSA